MDHQVLAALHKMWKNAKEAQLPLTKMDASTIKKFVESNEENLFAVMSVCDALFVSK